MESAGHTSAMLSRVKQDRSNSKARRARISKIREQYIDFKREEGFEFKSVSPEELAKVKERIRTEMKRDSRRKVIFLIISLIIFSAIIVALLLYLLV